MQNFDDCSGAERNLSDGPGRSEETCCKQFDAHEADDRPGDFPEGGSVEAILLLNSPCMRPDRLAALKSVPPQLDYTGSPFDKLWQDWIDNRGWNSLSRLFMEGAAGLSLTLPSGVEKDCDRLFSLLHRLLESLNCEKVGSCFYPFYEIYAEWYGNSRLSVNRREAFSILEMLLLHFQDQGAVIVPLSCVPDILMRIQVGKPTSLSEAKWRASIATEPFII